MDQLLLEPVRADSVPLDDLCWHKKTEWPAISFPHRSQSSSWCAASTSTLFQRHLIQPIPVRTSQTTPCGTHRAAARQPAVQDHCG